MQNHRNFHIAFSQSFFTLLDLQCLKHIARFTVLAEPVQTVKDESLGKRYGKAIANFHSLFARWKHSLWLQSRGAHKSLHEEPPTVCPLGSIGLCLTESVNAFRYSLSSQWKFLRWIFTEYYSVLFTGCFSLDAIRWVLEMVTFFYLLHIFQ